MPEGCATIVRLVQGLPLQIHGFDVDLKVVAFQTHAHASWGDVKRQEALVNAREKMAGEVCG